MSRLRTVIRATRPPFLILAPICVLLGISALSHQGITPDTSLALLALCGGVAVHVSVNTFNEYLDFRSGLDFLTSRTPFSGGSGSLPEAPRDAPWVLATAIGSALVALAIGVYFAWHSGPAIIPLGVLGLLLVLFYTRWINRFPWLCLLAPGTGFGVLMVVGTQVALGGQHTLSGWLVACVPFLLVNNLLLLNQYPDIEADRQVGRRHFPIAYGIAASNRAFIAFVLLAVLSVVAGTWSGLLPRLALLALLPLPLALFAWFGAQRLGAAIGSQPRFLAANVMAALASPALLAWGMWQGA